MNSDDLDATIRYSLPIYALELKPQKEKSRDFVCEHVGIRSSPFRSYGKMKQIIILVTARLDFESAGRLEYNDISGEN